MQDRYRPNRRSFLKGVGSLTVGCSVVGATVHGVNAASPMRLGGPVFVKSDDPELLAQAHRDLGYRAAYAPNLKLTDSQGIKATVSAFSNKDVVIAEVGAWVNMLDPDSTKRKENLAFVTDKLALAEELGARCCVDIAGSFNAENWSGPHPDNFSQRFLEETVENVRKIVDAVKPSRTKFSIEMMGWTIPSSPDEYLRLLQAVDRPSFAVHIDVCNMVNSPARMYNNTALIQECFAKLGPNIVSCHAKDVAWVPASQVHLKEVIPGRGVIDYKTYLREIAQLPVDAPLMLEHLTSAEEYDEGRRHIQDVARQLGLSFS